MDFPKVKGISRIDQPSRNTHGWFARFSCGKKQVGKFFSDLKHGSARKALLEAIEWREQMLEAHGIPSTDRVVHTVPKKRRKPAPPERKVLGVHRTRSVFKKPYGTYAYEYYVASWSPEPGKLKNKMFSINRYGEKRAFEMAKQFREERMKDLFGQVPGNPPLTLLSAGKPRP